MRLMRSCLVISSASKGLISGSGGLGSEIKSTSQEREPAARLVLQAQLQMQVLERLWCPVLGLRRMAVGLPSAIETAETLHLPAC